jgi:preprotein translocase subunit Sec61beta
VRSMSKKDKSVMPQSTAGLVRYFETSKESIKIKPEHILIAATGFIVIELLIKFI